MVIYGYGNDPNEQDAREEREFRKTWRDEIERVAKTTPEPWRNRLLEIYSNVPHERLSTSPPRFVDNIAWRVYTEACTNPGEKFDSTTYHGQALMEFIGREMQFASERASKKGLLEQPPFKDNPLETISTKVLEAIVNRAIELFSDWRGITSPASEEDKRNLRTSLEPYIGF